MNIKTSLVKFRVPSYL